MFVSTPVFSGAEVEDVNEAIEKVRKDGVAKRAWAGEAR